jgi:hypothetical protein
MNAPPRDFRLSLEATTGTDVDVFSSSGDPLFQRRRRRADGGLTQQKKVSRKVPDGKWDEYQR